MMYVFARTMFAVVWRDTLDPRIAQGIWLGPWSKAPMGKPEFIEN